MRRGAMHTGRLAVALLALALTLTGACALHRGAFDARDWVSTGRADADDRINFMIMLNQRVPHEEMHETLMAVSDPASAQYGQHLSVHEVRERFSPRQEQVDEVFAWLQERMPRSWAQLNLQGDMIAVDTTIAEAEALLQTELHWFRSVLELTPKRYVRATQEIAVPEHLESTIALISLNANINGNYPLSGRKLRESGVGEVDTTGANSVSVTSGNELVQALFQVTCGDLSDNVDPTPCATLSAANQPVIVATATNVKDTEPPTMIVLDNSLIECFQFNESTGAISTQLCDSTSTAGVGCVCVGNVGPLSKYVTYTLNVTGTFEDGSSMSFGESTFFTLTDVATPYFLYDLYNVPYGIKVRNNATNAVPEFLEEYYSPSDLATFFDLVGMDEEVVDTVLGTTPNIESDPGGEAQLDVEYMLAMSPGANTTFYSMGGRNPFSSENEPFLAWLYILGNQTNPPAVQSVSYGDDEASIFNTSNPGSSAYGNACSNQFMLAGMRGISIVVASGDDGASSFLIRTDTSYCQTAVPNWPAGDPYITCVGATQMTTEYLPFCEDMYAGSPIDLPVECSDTHETMCDSLLGGVITSGGGFSNVYNRNQYASYQNAAVQAYLDRTDIIPPESFFNSSGRAYPDVSTYGSNYFVYLGETITRESGTSASSPVFAGLVTLLNDMRAGYNMSALGFLNPWLYHVASRTPEAFQDVTTGSNNCSAGRGDSINCCDTAFSAAAGWDAVTGLGTPDFGVLANLAVNPTVEYPSVNAIGVAGADGTDGQDGQDATDDDNKDGGNNGDDDSADDGEGDSIATVALVFALVSVLSAGATSYRLFTANDVNLVVNDE